MPAGAVPLALQLVVHDDAAFLRPNLLYHRAVGVDRCYVFADRCLSEARVATRGLPWVEVFERERRPGEPLTAFLCACAEEARDQARRDGYAWLLCLDADEFAAAGQPTADALGRVRRSRPADDPHLASRLSCVRPETEVLRFHTRELVPTSCPDPFWEQTLFQSGYGVRRHVRHPATGERHLVRWIGHEIGKTIVRTAAPLAPDTTHAWRAIDDRSAQEEVREEAVGWVYHFAVTGAAHWRRKYARIADTPDRFEGGAPTRFPKVAWKRLARDMDEQRAARYYRRVVAVGRLRVLAHRLLGTVTRDPTVRDIVTRALAE